MDTFDRFTAIFDKGNIFVITCVLSCTTNPFWKGVYSKRKEFAWKGGYYKRKEFAPKGSKFFPFRVDPFSEVSETILTILL